MGLLERKNCLVTGAANGIGRAIVLRFLQEETAKIVAVDSDDFKLKEFRRGLAAPHQQRLESLYADVTSINAIDADVFPDPLHVLVHCAGVDEVFALGDDDKILRHVFEINFFAAHYLTKKVYQRMPAGASIIFITSVHTALSFPGGLAYDASKCALVGYMRSLARELASKRIRVNAVAPGHIHPTGISARRSEKENIEAGRKVLTGRHGAPRDVAEVVSFLASDTATYITGQEIRVDGGLSIQNALTD